MSEMSDKRIWQDAGPFKNWSPAAPLSTIPPSGFVRRREHEQRVYGERRRKPEFLGIFALAHEIPGTTGLAYVRSSGWYGATPDSLYGPYETEALAEERLQMLKRETKNREARIKRMAGFLWNNRDMLLFALAAVVLACGVIYVMMTPGMVD